MLKKLIIIKRTDKIENIQLFDSNRNAQPKQGFNDTEHFEESNGKQNTDFGDTDVKQEAITDTSNDQSTTEDQKNLVLYNKDFLKDKLKSILHSHRFCAVCFESNNYLKSLDEELIIISDNWTQTILLKHVYTYVFKQTETSASGYICTECTTQLQQAYIFIKYSQLTSSLLNEYIDDAQSKIGKVQDLHEDEENYPNEIIIILENNKCSVNQEIVDKESIKSFHPIESYECEPETIQKEVIEVDNELKEMESQPKETVIKQVYVKLKPKYRNKCEFCSERKTNLYHYAYKHAKVICKSCDISVDEENIKQHLMKNHKDNLYICNLCNNPFYTKNSVKLHALIMHDSKMDWTVPSYYATYAQEIYNFEAELKCPDCSKAPCLHKKYLDLFTDQTINHKHILAKCADCDFVCRTKAVLLHHVNATHLNGWQHICDQCGRQFYCKQLLRRHIRTCHQTKNVYICKYCDEQFESSDIVTNHETSCSSIERVYRCEHCTASFNTNELLQKHHKLRHKEVFPCQYCNKELLTEAMRKRHIVNVHSSVRIPTKYKFKCDICQEELVSRNKLKQHIKAHGSNVRYQCKICSKEYSSIRIFKKHRSNCHVQRDVCNICGRRIKEFLMEKHLEQHKLDAVVKCDVCRRTFNNIARLRTHMKCHLRPKPKKISKAKKRQYKCRSCDYVAPNSATLDKHTSSKHLHINTYICDICKEQFSGKNLLIKHIEYWHLPRKIYTCPVCKKIYYNIRKLKTHVKGHK